MEMAVSNYKLCMQYDVAELIISITADTGTVTPVCCDLCMIGMFHDTLQPEPLKESNAINGTVLYGIYIAKIVCDRPFGVHEPIML